MTAADIVNDYSEEDLYRIIRDYGEDRFAKNIAKNIVKERQKERITRAGQLNQIIERSIPKKLQVTGGHPAKRTYQAIRIELNRELDVLEQNLGASGEDGYDLRQLPQDWYSCVIDLWRFVYPGVYGAKYSTKAPDDADLLKWLADDGFSDGSSPCHWWLDGYLLGSRQHVQWPTAVEWPSH